MMNENVGRGTELTSMGVKIKGWKMVIYTWGEIQEPIKKLKVGYAHGIDSTTVQMLKYDYVLAERMLWICSVLEQRTGKGKSITVLLYKGKGNRDNWNNFRGISLLCMAGKSVI